MTPKLRNNGRRRKGTGGAGIRKGKSSHRSGPLLGKKFIVAKVSDMKKRVPLRNKITSALDVLEPLKLTMNERAVVNTIRGLVDKGKSRKLTERKLKQLYRIAKRHAIRIEK